MNSSGNSDYDCITTEVTLGEMFGYSAELRSITQGKGKYARVYLQHVGIFRKTHILLNLMRNGRKRVDIKRIFLKKGSLHVFI